MIIRSGVLTAGNPSITGLSKTNDIHTGLYIYGNYLPVTTKVLSIDSATSLTLNKNALSSGTVTLEFSPICTAPYFERQCALIDAQNVINERGDEVTLIIRTETGVTRDAYGSIVKKQDATKYYFKSYPINWSPNSDTLKQAGLREECNVIVNFGMKDFKDNGLNFADLDINRMSVILQGQDFEIKEKGLNSQFSDTFLYISFGLFKR
jgi:hypothetical protein